MKIKLIMLCLLCAVFQLRGQQEPKEYIEQFFTTFESESASKAIDDLYATNKWMERVTDAMVKLKSQLESLNEDYVGKNHGYEILAEKKLTESYVLLSYIVKYERQPIRFTFQFYKPADSWMLYKFQFDGDIDEEIEETAKIYNLHLY